MSTATSTAGQTAPATTVTPPSRLKLALTLGAFVALGPLTIDMYLPALPTIADDLGTTSAAVQLTLTGTLLGLALGQLVLGPLADRFGRKRPLIAGTALHVVASLLVLVAPNIAVLGALRVLQGVGTAAGAVIALAVVRDLYTGRAAATLLSRLFLVIGAAPVLAPTLGGELLRYTSWRGVFVALAVYGLLLVLVVGASLPETLPAERRNSSGLRGTARAYTALFRDRVFVGLVGVAGLTMAGLFSYVSGASFVYQDEFGLDEQQFGLLFGAGAVWLIGATQLNPVLLRRFQPQAILVGGLALAGAAGVVLLVLASTGTGGLFGVAIPIWVVLAGSGLALPNAPAIAL
ncbi:MAG: Bcr/CflA family efflux MFS transporter, partial [Actinobacteria bacterium]|nr:Bcr/CflA family efflux MFS transporter [Actinomycetota bacterium]